MYWTLIVDDNRVARLMLPEVLKKMEHIASLVNFTLCRNDPGTEEDG